LSSYVAVVRDALSLKYRAAGDAHAKQLPYRWNVRCTWLGRRQRRAAFAQAELGFVVCGPVHVDSNAISSWDPDSDGRSATGSIRPRF
jgi:hypothetical protein